MSYHKSLTWWQSLCQLLVLFDPYVQVFTLFVFITKIFLHFFPDNEADLKKAAQYLLDSCKPGASVCLICIASIKHVDAVSLEVFNLSIYQYKT